MTDTLVDTNIFLDLLTRSEWRNWSADALRVARGRGSLVVTDAVFSELSVGFSTSAEVDEFLADFEASVQHLSRPALFLAGKAFQSYRRRGGTRTGVLPDFFIGAHAQVEQLPLLTRDRRRYETYFPQVELIAP